MQNERMKKLYKKDDLYLWKATIGPRIGPNMIIPFSRDNIRNSMPKIRKFIKAQVISDVLRVIQSARVPSKRRRLVLVCRL